MKTNDHEKCHGCIVIAQELFKAAEMARAAADSIDDSGLRLTALSTIFATLIQATQSVGDDLTSKEIKEVFDACAMDMTQFYEGRFN